MKKELIIAALFAAAVVCAFAANMYVSMITRDVLTLCEQSLAAAESGDWETAQTLALEAGDYWESHDNRTHVLLRHNVIEGVDLALNAFFGYVSARNHAEASASYRSVRATLCGIEESERIRLGSIF